MADFFIKIFEWLFESLFPNSLKEVQIKVARLNFSNPSEVESLIKLYNEGFPNDGTNYDAAELIETVDIILPKI